MKKELRTIKNGLHIKAVLRIENYFSLTGEIWEGKPKYDESNLWNCGAIGEKLLEYFPQLEPFEKMHLANLEGIPMHAVANGIYHLKNGFSNCPVDSEGFNKAFSKHYRIDKNFIKELYGLSSINYTLKLQELGILDKWKKEAEQAIELFNSL